MLSDESVAAIDAHWAADFGCTVEELRGQDAVVSHNGHGIFILSRSGVAVAVPPNMPPEGLIGPAFIGYLDAGSYAGGEEEGARLLDDSDAGAIAELRAACEPLAWEHGGPDDAVVAVGAFRGAALASVASYEIWSGRIAHIGIVTHPAHRGRGAGKAAVRATTRIALERGLIAQYRTLCANAPSMGIARALGFARYAVTISIRADALRPR